MSVYVFAGPTIAAGDARAVLDATYLPPASQGDVIRVARRRPRAIGIIDGYFERVPAVWHKEILWAMSEGIHVFGSASMGALRAAELVAFGMEGIGAIYEAYHDGRLEDDDEVAVAHGSAEAGYAAQSEAMVNIRATLAVAEALGVIGPATRETLEQVGKDLYYPERTYPRILALAVEHGVAGMELDRLRGWLATGRIDQKREDALAMLGTMRERITPNLAPKRVGFSFEHTNHWVQASRLAGEIGDGAEAESGPPHLITSLVEELRLDGDGYAHARRGAAVRWLAVELARLQGTTIPAETLAETAAAFRRERSLLSTEDTERWIEVNELTGDAFERLMEHEAWLRRVIGEAGDALIGHLVDHLRAAGDYSRLAERAREKEQRLQSLGMQDPSLADARMTEAGLWRWYFEERLMRPVPEDMAAYARDHGFGYLDTFRRAVLREYWFMCATRQASAPV